MVDARPTRAGAEPRCHVGHGWLPLVIPAEARRLRVADPVLRETLAAAGAELTDAEPEVEIGPEPAGDAPLAVVPIDASPPEGGSRAVRAVRRVTAHARVRSQARAAARSLRRSYPSVEILLWDLDRPVGRAAALGRRSGRLHSRALVVARSSGGHRPLVSDVLAGARIETAPFVARVVVAAGDELVARVAIGPAARQIETQREALDVLREAGPPEALARLVPWVAQHGTTGLATWSLERRLPGVPVELPLDRALERECVDLLVTLHGLGHANGGRGALARDAESVAEALPAEGDAIVALAAEAEQALADVPRGFGHGDFWSGNLLAGDGRLSGVVDWDGAGPERLPLLDLLHLRLNGERVLPPEEWGACLVERLLPWARAGGDDLARDYLARIGVELDATQLEALVVAYWLDRVAYQVALYDELATSPLWLRRNVLEVLEGLGRPARVELSPPQPAERLEPEWSELAEASRNVFATPEWTRIWWRHFGRGELRVRAARDDDGRMVAVLPVYAWRRRPLRIVRMVGSGPSDRLAPVCRPGDRAAAARALLAALREDGADLFVGEQFPADEGWAALLGARRLSRTGSPVLCFDGTWDEFLASRSRNFREQVRRRERRLQREHELVYRLAADPERLQADLDVLFRLHAAHWGEGESDFLRQERFHREFAACALERGWLRLWLLELDGAPVAAWYGFRFAGVECYYQAGRDSAWEDASVGFVLLAHSIRAALEDGAEEYWFLRGGESYKYRFATGDPGLETLGVAGSAAGQVAMEAASRLRRLRHAGTVVAYVTAQLVDVLRT